MGWRGVRWDTERAMGCWKGVTDSWICRTMYLYEHQLMKCGESRDGTLRDDDEHSY